MNSKLKKKKSLPLKIYTLCDGRIIFFLLNTIFFDFYSIAVPPHRETHLAQEALRTSFADTGNVYQCLIIT